MLVNVPVRGIKHIPVCSCQQATNAARTKDTHVCLQCEQRRRRFERSVWARTHVPRPLTFGWQRPNWCPRTITLTACRSLNPSLVKTFLTALIVGASFTCIGQPWGASTADPKSADGRRDPLVLSKSSPKGHFDGPYLSVASSSVKSTRPYENGMNGPPDA